MAHGFKIGDKVKIENVAMVLLPLVISYYSIQRDDVFTITHIHDIDPNFLAIDKIKFIQINGETGEVEDEGCDPYWIYYRDLILVETPVPQIPRFWE